MKVKALLKNLLGPTNMGRVDYFRHAEFKNIWGGAFNGQRLRRQIYEALISDLSVHCIVETGSFKGNTTVLFAEAGMPVYTVEFDKRNFGYVDTRFKRVSHVHVYNDDSRSFLKQLIAGGLIDKEQTVLFYLDAHWYKDLPLREELNIIFSNCSNCVVMIDDFHVPDMSYAYDDYGSGNVLNIDYLSTTEHYKDYVVFFPAFDAHQETGFKRGCALLAVDDRVIEPLKKIPLLKEFQGLV